MRLGPLARELALTEKKVWQCEKVTCILGPELFILVNSSEKPPLDAARKRHPSEDAGFQL